MCSLSLLLLLWLQVSVGDRVLYSSYAEETSQLKIGEDVFAFVRAAELAAKF